LNRFLIKKILTFILCLALLTSLAGCSKSLSRMEPKEAIEEIFGVYENDNESGITMVTVTSDEAIIYYNFSPLGIKDFYYELGINLSDKINKFYSNNTSISNLVFKIFGPFQDNYGNIKWKRMIEFEVSRELYEKINWDNFYGKDLITIVENIKQ